MSRRARIFRRVLVGVVLLVSGWLGSSFFVAYRLTRRAHAKTYTHTSPPMFDGADAQATWLETDDGERLEAWIASPSGSEPRGVILLLHGHRGSLRQPFFRRAERLVRDGYAVFAISQRAHGMSSGELIDFGYSSRHDVVAAVDWLDDRLPGVPIVVLGSSMGAAAAVFAGEALGERVAGYVLECLYRDLHAATWNRSRLVLPPFIDAIAYAGLRVVGPVLLPHFYDISPVDHIRSIPESVPILILAGSEDLRALPGESRDIHEQAVGHSELVIFEGAGHGSLPDDMGEEYWATVLPFLERASASE